VTTEQKGDSENDDNADHLQSFRDGRIQLSRHLETKTGGAAQRPGSKPGNENNRGCLDRKVSLLMSGIRDRSNQRLRDSLEMSRCLVDPAFHEQTFWRRTGHSHPSTAGLSA